MKIGILTFQFAHNYGAMLQAYALRRYLEEQGHESIVIPYFPTHFQAQYSISPLVRGVSIKRRIRNLIYYIYNEPQAKLFDEFKERYVYNNIEEGRTKEFTDIKHLQQYYNDLELIVFGSDQIWNVDITHMDGTYWGKNINGRKIAFAASVGTKDCSQKQISIMENYLQELEVISVREPSTKYLLEKNVKKNIEVVCDPVFLLEKDEWEALEQTVDIHFPYILLYMLKEDKSLVELAYECARKNNLTIYEIHPTLAIKHEGTELLKMVGPREFIYLINHAEYICTNSFHGVCFSIIFRKKLIHIPNDSSPERTMAILEKIGVEKASNNTYAVDLREYVYSNLYKLVKTSKTYLENL